MGEMWGSLKWDDDNLTPGKSKDGGHHNNLYDSDGKLKGAASFIPGDKPDPGTPKQSVDKPGTKGQKPPPDPGLAALIKGEVADILGEIVKDAAKTLVVEATPHAKKLWNEKGRPALEAKRAEAAHEAKVLWNEKAMPVIDRQVGRRIEKIAARKKPKVVAMQPRIIEGEVVSVEE
ncbi:hypothetical protein [Rhodococcus sp. 077-4]|uniref:hypothetical protein n=1 Tax=Rhodococcus sp. 077-4 TaxID=2789271 RepID=UPI0039F54CCE